MRSPGVVYRRYRQVKRKTLYEKIKNSNRKIHANCFYGRTIYHKDINNQIQATHLCFYNFSTEGKIEICTNPSDCNAFICKWTKQKIKEEFDNQLKNPKIKHALYPTLCSYEWILDKSLTEAKKHPGILNSLIVSIINFLENILKRLNGPQKTLM